MNGSLALHRPAMMLLLMLLMAITVQPAPAQDKTAEWNAAILGHVSGIYPKLGSLYEDIHASPELGFQEVKTAARLASEMRALGFDVVEQVGKTGVVAIYRNGPGPTVMVRTELDALPMEEKTGLPYASKARTQWQGRETYVAHSCGHDVHMAAWVGTASTLVSMKDRWQGTLMFVAQPAEEGGGGAKAMLADGLFTRFPKPDVAFALHATPAPFGYVGYNVGTVTSNVDGLLIVFKGRGGHGSAPHRTIDPIAIAARFIVDVQTVVSREKDPTEFGVVTIGAIQGGTAGNIIPDTVTLRGTIRSYNPDVRAKLLAGVTRTANAAAAMAGAPEPQVSMGEGGPGVVNSEMVVTRTEAILRSVLGSEKARRWPPSTASEDFSLFVNEGVPGMYFFIGTFDPQQVAESRKPGGQPVPSNHSPLFAPVPEPSIKTGVQAMSLAVLGSLPSR